MPSSLAAAGLLDGRRATTHWDACGLLDDRYEGVTVDADAIYVRDGNVWTSAGVTAGIDLALALVADDHGRGAAATVARRLVVYLQRSGGQAQFSAVLAAQAADTAPVSDLLSWLRDHLTDDLTVAALARQINLSERQFSRVFKSEVGSPPRTTWKPFASSQHAGCWKRRTERSSRSPGLRLRHP